MARQRPLQQTEKNICLRLRAFRIERKVSQVAFAQAIGISGAKLASHEYGRVPVRYSLAKSVGQKFNLNLAWLCYGIGPSSGYEPPFEKIEATIPSAALLSEALDQFLPEAKKRQVLREKGIRRGIKTTFMIPMLGVPTEEYPEQEIATAALEASRGLPRELAGKFFWCLAKAAKDFCKKHRVQLHGLFHYRPPPLLEE